MMDVLKGIGLFHMEVSLWLRRVLGSGERRKSGGLINYGQRLVVETPVESLTPRVPDCGGNRFWGLGEKRQQTLG
jgi:hypothetical protein